MIVSYAHNYIFIKTSKVAGTSVEMALSRHRGPDDVITPIYPNDEIRRPPEARRPQNFASDPELEQRYAAAAERQDLEAVWALFHKLEGTSRFYNHMRATDIRNAVGEAFWRDAFKFVIERNPYERIVSNAFWKIRDKGGPSNPDSKTIASEIDRAIEISWDSTEFYMVDGRIAVDRILRYENLKADLASIAGRIGFDISGNLPRAKSGMRTADQTAANLLTTEQKQRIADRHARTFDLLGYRKEI